MTALVLFKAIKPGKAISKPDTPPAKPAKGKEPAKAQKATKAPESNPAFVGLLALLQERGIGPQSYGKHNVHPGHEVEFSAGEFKGRGEVAAAGEHGAVVKDASGREHRVHWPEVTSAKAKAAKGKDGK